MGTIEEKAKQAAIAAGAVQTADADVPKPEGTGQVVLAVRFPYGEYDPGDGQEKVLATGTRFSRENADKVLEAAKGSGVSVYEVKEQ